MKPALLDTDTISYFFRNETRVVDKVDTYLQEHGYIHLSVITYYEILNGLLYKDARKQLELFKQFADANAIGHNDVLIAATAIVHGMALISNNVNHFSRVSELDLDNWV